MLMDSPNATDAGLPLPFYRDAVYIFKCDAGMLCSPDAGCAVAGQECKLFWRQEAPPPCPQGGVHVASFRWTFSCSSNLLLAF